MHEKYKTTQVLMLQNRVKTGKLSLYRTYMEYYNLYARYFLFSYIYIIFYSILFYSRSMRENLMNSVLEMGHETTIGTTLTLVLMGC